MKITVYNGPGPAYHCLIASGNEAHSDREQTMFFNVLGIKMDASHISTQLKAEPGPDAAAKLLVILDDWAAHKNVFRVFVSNGEANVMPEEFSRKWGQWVDARGVALKGEK